MFVGNLRLGDDINVRLFMFVSTKPYGTNNCSIAEHVDLKKKTPNL